MGAAQHHKREHPADVLPAPCDDVLRLGIPLVAAVGNNSALDDSSDLDFFRLDTRERMFSIPLPDRSVDLVRCELQGEAVFAVAAPGGRIMFVDLKTREVLHKASFESGFYFRHGLVDLPSDPFGEDLLALGSYDGVVRVFNKSKRCQLEGFQDLQGHCGPVLSLACDPCRKWLVSGSEDHTVCVWDLGSSVGVPHGVIRDHTNEVRGVLFHEERRSIFSGSFDGTVRIFPANTLKCARTFHDPGPTTCLLFHPTNPNLFFSGDVVRSVLLWDIRKEDAYVAGRVTHERAVEEMVHVGRNRFASCSRDGAIRLWGEDLAPFADDGQDLVSSIMRRKGDPFYRALCCVVPLEDSLDDVVVPERLEFLQASAGFTALVELIQTSSFDGSASSCCPRFWKSLL